MNDNGSKTPLTQASYSSKNQSPPPSVLKRNNQTYCQFFTHSEIEFALRLFPNFFSDSNPSIFSFLLQLFSIFSSFKPKE